MCPRNRDRSLKCGTPRSPKPIVSAISTPPPCPPSAASTSDLPPLSCPAPTISTPRSRRHRAQKLGRKDQRAGLARSCPSHIFIGDTKRLRRFATSSSTPFISRSPFSPHSSSLSHLLLPPLQPLSRCPSTCLLSPRTCNGFENHVRRGRQRGSARAGRAEGISAAPPGSGTPPSSHTDEVAPRRAEQQGFVLRHLVAEHPSAPSSSTWAQTTSGCGTSAATPRACPRAAEP